MKCPEPSVLDVLQEFDNELMMIRETAKLMLRRLQLVGEDTAPSAAACEIIIDQTRLIECQLSRPLNAMQDARSNVRLSIPRVSLEYIAPPISATLPPTTPEA